MIFYHTSHSAVSNSGHAVPGTELTLEFTVSVLTLANVPLRTCAVVLLI
uniref:Uncharacterized protein n=1 Tax=Anguilla anguilla TaxID=7936 RepID=A0A0E9RLT6_ANGAN